MSFKNRDLDYELLDAGDFLKFERFGKYRLLRPSSLAAWPMNDSRKIKTSDARFIRLSSRGGKWELDNASNEQWNINVMDFKMRLGLTDFGHTGLFPEQYDNWNWLRDEVQTFDTEDQILNLFAYTGASTFACSSGKATVCHVDASKKTVSWARENSEISGFKDRKIRWIVEDALKFVQREQRRKRKYRGIILDPPTFGRGSNNQLWKIENDLIGLLNACADLLPDDKESFILLTCNTPGYTPIVLKNLLNSIMSRRDRKAFKAKQSFDAGEMLIPFSDSSEMSLPAGTFCRWKG